MKQLQLTLLVFAFLVAIANVHAQTSDQAQLLEDAFQKGSVPKLKTFFENWEKEIPAISDSELNTLNRYDREAYAVFKAFYYPDEYHELVWGNWDTSMSFRYNGYKKVPYVILPTAIAVYKSNSIYVTKNDSDSAFVKLYPAQAKKDLADLSLKKKSRVYELSGDGQVVLVDSIKNFRPQIHCDNKKPFYWDQTKIVALNTFLGHSALSLDSIKKINPKMAVGSLDQREKFLNNFICPRSNKIDDYQYWGFVSYPMVECVTFNSDFSKARVSLRCLDCGAVGVLKKENGKWKVMAVHETWVE